MDSRDHQAGHYYLGVDSGGTKTIAVIVDGQGQEQGRGLAGASNPNNIGLEPAMRNLRQAIESAMQAAGSQAPLHKAWLGISGFSRPADYDVFYPYLHDLADAIHMTNDGELGLSTLEGAVGVAIIAGTGSIVLGRNAQGQRVRAGGWGYLLGDEGSGYYVAQQALIAAVRAADGRGQPTILLDLILQHWGISNPTDIISQVYVDSHKAKIAQFSTHVFKAARQGDTIAAQIVQKAAQELALAARIVASQLALSRVPLALTGGLLEHETNYREQVLASISEAYELGQVEIVTDPGLSAARAIINLELA
jgi:N-acetylglucosamine kinase-like BadF-type ATPase